MLSSHQPSLVLVPSPTHTHTVWKQLALDNIPPPAQPSPTLPSPPHHTHTHAQFVSSLVQEALDFRGKDLAARIEPFKDALESALTEGPEVLSTAEFQEGACMLMRTLHNLAEDMPKVCLRCLYVGVRCCVQGRGRDDDVLSPAKIQEGACMLMHTLHGLAEDVPKVCAVFFVACCLRCAWWGHLRCFPAKIQLGACMLMHMRLLHGLAEEMPEAPCCAFCGWLCDEKGEDAQCACLVLSTLSTREMHSYRHLDRWPSLSATSLRSTACPCNRCVTMEPLMTHALHTHTHTHTGPWTGGSASGRLPRA